MAWVKRRTWVIGEHGGQVGKGCWAYVAGWQVDRCGPGDKYAVGRGVGVREVEAMR